MSRLCVTVTGSTTAELRRRRDEVSGADLVELRVDTVSDPDAAAALADRRLPAIFTCRAAWEGGHFRGSEDERHRLLAEAQRLGAEYVDVEWRARHAGLIETSGGRGIVVSMHDFEGVPDDLVQRAAAMRATGAEIVKVAVTASRLTDSLALLPVRERLDGPLVLIAMGDAGVPSRLLADRFGSQWTYAGEHVAPGQMPAARLQLEYRIDRVSAATAVYGVVGRPVLHSLSPAMHNAAFRAAGLDAVYVPLPATDFDDFQRFAGAVGLAGASVTAPFKRAALAAAGIPDAISTATGAANTWRRTGHAWAATNTDVDGFMAPLVARLAIAGRRVTILGAGGAARAVAFGLSAAGARVSIAARDPGRARAVAAMTQATVADWPPAAGTWDVLVNTTPLGAAPGIGASPLPDGPFGGELVYDLVYTPQDTRLLRDARAAGCRTIGGLEMLVAQAERQFAWWTGRPPAPDVMRTAAERALDARGRSAPTALTPATAGPHR